MRILHVLAFLLSLSVASMLDAISWKAALDAPTDWYQSAEAAEVLEAVLAYQFPSGGWPKNHEMRTVPTAKERKALHASKRRGTIDNGATYQQIEFLSRYHTATSDPRAEKGAVEGLRFLLRAQYENGGWPMFYPLTNGYHDHITFNDDAIAGVLNLFLDIVKGKEAYAFVDGALRQRVRDAFDRGIRCVLATQIKVGGVPTVWCAQHDARTLAPVPARAFEPASLSGAESVQLAKLLMRINPPTPEIGEAIEGAMTWFEAHALHDVKVVSNADKTDRLLARSPGAPRLWARFYELGTRRPIFADRDEKIYYSFNELSQERRIGYAYFGNWAEAVLTKNYPAWRERWIDANGELKQED